MKKIYQTPAMTAVTMKVTALQSASQVEGNGGIGNGGQGNDNNGGSEAQSRYGNVWNEGSYDEEY